MCLKIWWYWCIPLVSVGQALFRGAQRLRTSSQCMFKSDLLSVQGLKVAFETGKLAIKLRLPERDITHSLLEPCPNITLVLQMQFV